MRARPAALALAAVVAVGLSPSARTQRAEGAGFSMTLPAPGTCAPADGDGELTARVVRALGVGPTPTKPIAVLGSGVDPAVPQLAGRVLPGYDARTGGPATGDTDGHGTTVAGMAASSGPGMRGISPASPILPIRIAGADRAVTASVLARGIKLAVDHGAGVVLIAGSGPLADPLDAGTLEVVKAVDTALSAGTLVVAEATTSTFASTRGVATMPGSLPHVLTAGNATTKGTPVDTSGIGPWIDVIAPGDAVTGPLPQDVCSFGFGYGSKTSFAAAAVAGAAALAQARRRGLTTQQLFEVVRRGAADLGPAGRDDETGFGLLDVERVLSAAPQPKETAPEVDDDPYWVRGARAKRHRPLVSRKVTSAKATASVSAVKDPADVFPVSLTKGDRLRVVVEAADPGGILALSILSPSAGDFDVTNGTSGSRLAATDGVTDRPLLEVRAKRSGLHYVVVQASDPIDPDDPEATASPQDPYRLTVTRRPAKSGATGARAKPKAKAKAKARR